MPGTIEDVTSKTEMLEIDPKSGVALKPTVKEVSNEPEPKATESQPEKEVDKEPAEKGEEKTEQDKEPLEEEEVPVKVEPKSGISFPVKLADGKQLKAVGMRKKSMLGLGIKIYGFGNKFLPQLLSFTSIS